MCEFALMVQCISITIAIVSGEPALGEQTIMCYCGLYPHKVLGVWYQHLVLMWARLIYAFFYPIFPIFEE
jgi:hypothetical protein